MRIKMSGGSVGKGFKTKRKRKISMHGKDRYHGKDIVEVVEVE